MMVQAMLGFLTLQAHGYIYQSISATGVHTLSLYVKAGTALAFRLRVDQATDANYIIDLSDGSLVS